MKKIIVNFGISLFANAVILGFLANNVYAHGLPDFSKLVDANKEAVVNISTFRSAKSTRPSLPRGFELPEGYEDNPLNDLFKHFFGMPPGSEQWTPRQTQSLGSGFIISSDGYVVTNHHVIKGADEIVVRLNDRRELIAELIGSDSRSDIALLKLKEKNLPTLRLGSSNNLNVGEWVLAIGSPFGFDYSVTAGIVSAKGRSLPNENYVPFIQTDVAINPGNSGGPLFNLQGEVIGVNSQIYSRTGGFMGLSFAIPVELVLDVVEQLKQGGHVSRGWLGVLIQEVTRELAESFDMDKPQGALVSKILPDSPAEKAKIRTGDIILEFNNQNINRSSDLPPIVGRVKAGDSVKVKVLRDGRKQTIMVKIGELPDEKAEAGLFRPKNAKSKQKSRLGIVIQNPDQKTRDKYNLENRGVIVTDIKDGPAAAAGIRRGDVIESINNSPIQDVNDFIKKLDALKPGSSVALLIQRGAGPIYLAIRMPKNE